MSDPVNHPSHYTHGRFEAIDVIEDAVTGADNDTLAYLHGNVLKYLLRLWHKENSVQDAKKARWYLNRLIDHLEPTPHEPKPTVYEPNPLFRPSAFESAVAWSTGTDLQDSDGFSFGDPR